MPRRPRVANINELVAHINKQLDAFSVSYDQLNLRQRVEKLVEIRHGSDDLRPGEYVLLDSERIAEPHDRKITVEVQQVVYQRDENTCRKCMWNNPATFTSKVFLVRLCHWSLRFENDERQPPTDARSTKRSFCGVLPLPSISLYLRHGFR